MNTTISPSLANPDPHAHICRVSSQICPTVTMSAVQSDCRTSKITTAHASKLFTVLGFSAELYHIKNNEWYEMFIVYVRVIVGGMYLLCL